MINLSDLENKLRIKFKNKDNIIKAFVHRSYLNESTEFTKSNERLEFLGDAVLELITTIFLYDNHPEFQEGMLTNLRASLVRTSTLSEIAKKLDFPNLLLISKGEEATGGKENSSILADTFEAFLGALYLDSGLDKVKIVLEKFLFPLLPEIIQSNSYKDSKSLLQEHAQSKLRLTPTYNLVSEEGPDHDKSFVMQVMIGDKKYEQGMGKSKQLAQDDAAAKTLEILQNT